MAYIGRDRKSLVLKWDIRGYLVLRLPSLSVLIIVKHSWRRLPARKHVAKADGGERDEAEVGGVQETPALPGGEGSGAESQVGAEQQQDDERGHAARDAPEGRCLAGWRRRSSPRLPGSAPDERHSGGCGVLHGPADRWYLRPVV